jgi:cytochrome c peroxidase
MRFQALNLNAQSLFEEDAYFSHFFTRLQKKNTNQNLVLLGKTLFFDPLLSRNNKIACATCHHPSKAYTDGLPKASGMLTGETLLRNTPTLLNAALQRDLFYDARVRLLEDQVESVVQNEKEMHGDFGAVAGKLNNSSEYKKLFAQAFMGTKDTVISRQGILTAIAEFERTLLSINSRFDKSIRNEKMLLTENEIKGYNLFMGKARCGQCHFAGLFNGALPPSFEETELEILGVPSTEEPPYSLDTDEGRYAAFKTEQLKHAFKTTTVRNSELTAPYMHNGVFTNLKNVVNFYNKGGGEGFKINVPSQTLPNDSLLLTDIEVENVVAFLKSLTDTGNVVHFSGSLPSIEKQPELNNRKVGGDY